MSGRIIIELWGPDNDRLERIDTADYKNCAGVFLEIVPDHIRCESATGRFWRNVRSRYNDPPASVHGCSSHALDKSASRCGEQLKSKEGGQAATTEVR